MYKLYWDAGTAAMAAHAALEEIATPFELVRVDLDKDEQHSDWYLKINPLGRVPALANKEQVISEAAAILMYVADRHPGARLAPAVDARERGSYLRWIAYLTNTMQETMLHWFYPGKYSTSEAAQADVHAHAEQRLADHCRYIDRALAGGPYLLGETFSAADFFLVMLCRWTRNTPKPAATYPNIKRCIDLVVARPAWQRMMKAQGITWSGKLEG
ncbi:MAG: glutathione S-transferase family protein [Dongiaceae bacterium]